METNEKKQRLSIPSVWGSMKFILIGVAVLLSIGYFFVKKDKDAVGYLELISWADIAASLLLPFMCWMLKDFMLNFGEDSKAFTWLVWTAAITGLISALDYFVLWSDSVSLIMVPALVMYLIYSVIIGLKLRKMQIPVEGLSTLAYLLISAPVFLLFSFFAEDYIVEIIDLAYSGAVIYYVYDLLQNAEEYNETILPNENIEEA